jgi:tagatose 6-phosphate kinase
MITTVTLNAAIDKTYYLPQFQLGTVSRVKQMLAVPGGKGINVARVIHQLGERVLTTGFIGGSNGQFIKSELQKLGIDYDFVDIQGESRLCLNIIDESDQSSTEILEPGPTIQIKDIEAIKERVRKLSQKSKVITFSGSVPNGTPNDVYAELIQIAKSEGAKVLLDTSGDALVKAIKAQPFLIKPNEHEVEIIIGRKIERESDLYNSILQLLQSGIECVVVSLGGKGSVVGYKGELHRITAPQISAVNTVGCGDSFVAGMAYGVAKGRTIMECLRLATAVGSANALTVQAGFVRKEDVESLLPLVEIETISI